MKENVDLTTNRKFSARSGMFRFIEASYHLDYAVSRFFATRTRHISKLDRILKIPHWTARCISKDRFMRELGVSRFVKVEDTDGEMDYLINNDCQCPRCGRIKVPWKTFCKRCGELMEEESKVMSIDDYRRFYGTWPRVRDVMKSNPADLHR